MKLNLPIALVAPFLAASTPFTNTVMSNPKISPPKVIFLDVNETLLDLGPIKDSVAEALGNRKDLVPLWFSTMLHHSLVDTLTGSYHPFPEIGVAALMMVAKSNGIELSREDAENAILPVIIDLPPHSDVVNGLKSLNSQGFQLVTLTNSSNKGVKKQLLDAGLIDLIDMSLTVDGVEKFKPHSDVYRWALEQVGVDADEAMLIAAHGWDIAGANAAGLQTTFINRPGKVLYPLAEKPNYIAADIKELASTLRTATEY